VMATQKEDGMQAGEYRNDRRSMRKCLRLIRKRWLAAYPKKQKALEKALISALSYITATDECDIWTFIQQERRDGNGWGVL